MDAVDSKERYIDMYYRYVVLSSKRKKDDTHCEIARCTIEGEAESMTNVTFAILKRILIAILHSRQSPQTN